MCVCVCGGASWYRKQAEEEERRGGARSVGELRCELRLKGHACPNARSQQQEHTHNTYTYTTQHILGGGEIHRHHEYYYSNLCAALSLVHRSPCRERRRQLMPRFFCFSARALSRSSVRYNDVVVCFFRPCCCLVWSHTIFQLDTNFVMVTHMDTFGVAGHTHTLEHQHWTCLPLYNAASCGSSNALASRWQLVSDQLDHDRSADRKTRTRRRGAARVRCIVLEHLGGSSCRVGATCIDRVLASEPTPVHNKPKQKPKQKKPSNTVDM